MPRKFRLGLPRKNAERKAQNCKKAIGINKKGRPRKNAERKAQNCKKAIGINKKGRPSNPSSSNTEESALDPNNTCRHSVDCIVYGSRNAHETP